MVSSSELPLISVIIPVYNGEQYVAEAIESVLAQTEVRLDLIVSDDGSTDRTAQIVAGYSGRLRCVSGPNGGPARAINAGVREARGEYLAFLDADDLWIAGKLASQMQALVGQSEYQMIFGLVRHFYSAELTAEVRQRLHCPAEPIAGCAAGTLLLSRQDFDRVGLFDTRWRTGEFMEWYGRALDAGLKSLILPQVLAARRVHCENLTLKTRNLRQSYAAMLKAMLDRRQREQMNG